MNANHLDLSKDFPLDHMKRADMRPKEALRINDQVVVNGTEILGRIVDFDADQRLARVDCGHAGGVHWFYVKDLRKAK